MTPPAKTLSAASMAVRTAIVLFVFVVAFTGLLAAGGLAPGLTAPGFSTPSNGFADMRIPPAGRSARHLPC